MPLFTTPDDDDDPGRPGRNALSLEEGVGSALDMDTMSLDVTRNALPIATVDAGGDGAPTPPDAPDFPRMDVPDDPPERDTEARRTNRLQALLGTLGTAIAAAGDDPMMLNIAGGLAQGGAQDLQRRREQFEKRQQAFQEAVTEAEKFNRQMRQRETEAEYERALSAFEQDREDRRQRAEATNERIQNEREHERTMEELRFKRGTRLWEQKLENQNEADRRRREPIKMGDLTIPNDPEAARRRLDQVNARIEEMKANRGRFQYQDTAPTPPQFEGGLTGERVVTRTDEEFRERLSQLEQYRRLLRDQVGATQGQGRGRRRDVNPNDPPAELRTENRETFLDSAPPQGGQQQGGRQQRTRRDTTARRDTTQQGGYAQELNETLRSRGRRATLMKIADDLEAGRITERQASAYYEQIAPDSLLQR